MSKSNVSAFRPKKLNSSRPEKVTVEVKKALLAVTTTALSAPPSELKRTVSSGRDLENVWEALGEKEMRLVRVVDGMDEKVSSR